MPMAFHAWHIGCITSVNKLSRCWVSKATLPTLAGRESVFRSRAVAFFFGRASHAAHRWPAIEV